MRWSFDSLLVLHADPLLVLHAKAYQAENQVYKPEASS